MTAISASQREKLAGGPGGPEVRFPCIFGFLILLNLGSSWSPLCNNEVPHLDSREVPFSCCRWTTNVDFQVTREMHIENEAAGSVIGKGGQKVGEIRKISGAQVK